MKKELTMTLAMSLVLSGAAMAQSPIPTFDKEAATVYPYNRTGDEKTVIDEVPEDFRPGNTGTEEAPAFYVKQIRLTGFSLPERDGRLSAILADYSGRSVKVDELRALTGRLTAYAKSCGYPVAQAVVPPQEVKDGLLEIRMYVASYDTVTVVKNTSDVTDSVIEGYLQRLKTGETMTDRKLEKAINNLNDLPGVIARAVLRPGSAPGTTAVDVEVMDRPIWNNYVFVDNGGGYYSGRYRYGFNLEIDNPGHQGDKIVLSGSMSSHDTDSWSARYEAPVGRDGTRLGVAYSRSEYELNTNDWYSTLGDSEGLSIYGLTPLYRDRSDRLTLIYGYDHREIENRYRFKGQVVPDLKNEKNANVWHVGISGSQYAPNEFLQYDLIYWYGDMSTDGGNTYIDGSYQKLTGDLFKVWYDGPWNYRFRGSWQLADKPLDGSEQFFLGGMSGVRAYGNGDGYGDAGWLGSFEIRRATGIEGLEAAVFLDGGYAKIRNGYGEHLYGWGVGLRYAMRDDWYAQLDYARKIDGRADWAEPDDHNGRLWFQVYKMF